MNNNDSSVWRPALNLAMVGFVTSLLLATINYFTAPLRLRNEKLAEENAREAVLPGQSSGEITELKGWFFRRLPNDKIGYVLPVIQRGYDGNIFMILGVDERFAVVDFKILKDRETPGLGSKAKEDFFRKQFVGRQFRCLELTKVNEPGKIQAITGATITSRAVMMGLKREMERLEHMAKQGFSNVPVMSQVIDDASASSCTACHTKKGKHE